MKNTRQIYYSTYFYSEQCLLVVDLDLLDEWFGFTIISDHGYIYRSESRFMFAEAAIKKAAITIGKFEYGS